MGICTVPLKYKIVPTLFSLAHTKEIHEIYTDAGLSFYLLCTCKPWFVNFVSKIISKFIDIFSFDI